MKKNMDLQIHVESLHHIAVVNCSGRMVRGAALDDFRRRVERLDRVRVLVLDLSEVEQIDAGGLGTLLLIRRWAIMKDTKLKMVNPPVFVRRVLEATKLITVFEISSLKDAISILKGKEGSSQFAVAC